MKVNARDLTAYILSKLGCLHPFHISRILLLAELNYYEERRERLTGLKYVRGPGVFYIEGLKEIFEKDKCFEVRRGDPSKDVRGCVAYKCEPPHLPSDVRRLVDKAIERAKGLSDEELNELVINHKYYNIVTQG